MDPEGTFRPVRHSDTRHVNIRRRRRTFGPEAYPQRLLLGNGASRRIRSRRRSSTNPLAQGGQRQDLVDRKSQLQPPRSCPATSRAFQPSMALSQTDSQAADYLHLRCATGPRRGSGAPRPRDKGSISSRASRPSVHLATTSDAAHRAGPRSARSSGKTRCVRQRSPRRRNPAEPATRTGKSPARTGGSPGTGLLVVHRQHSPARRTGWVAAKCAQRRHSPAGTDRTRWPRNSGPPRAPPSRSAATACCPGRSGPAGRRLAGRPRSHFVRRTRQGAAATSAAPAPRHPSQRAPSEWAARSASRGSRGPDCMSIALPFLDLRRL